MRHLNKSRLLFSSAEMFNKVASLANSVDPDQTASIGAVCSGSTLFASILNSSVMFCNYLQQTTFLGALRVKLDIRYSSVTNVTSIFKLITKLSKQTTCQRHTCLNSRFTLVVTYINRPNSNSQSLSQWIDILTC